MAREELKNLGEIGRGRADGELDPITNICAFCMQGRNSCPDCVKEMFVQGLSALERDEPVSTGPIPGKRIG